MRTYTVIVGLLLVILSVYAVSDDDVDTEDVVDPVDTEEVVEKPGSDLRKRQGEPLPSTLFSARGKGVGFGRIR